MTPETRQNLAHILLIELLGYQFASPVKWIETQNVLVEDFQIEKLIEIGPQPILSNMMKKTFGEKEALMFSNGKTNIECFCVSDFNNIQYYQNFERNKQLNNEKVTSKTIAQSNEKICHNPFVKPLNTINLFEEEQVTFVDFVNVETFKRNHETKCIQTIDFEKEKQLINNLALDMAPKNNFVTDFISLSDENKKLNAELLQVSTKKPIPFYDETKIRCYDNAYNWLKEDIFEIALASNFADVEDYIKTRIFNFLKNKSIPSTIINQFDSILRFYNKSLEGLMNYYIANIKEQDCYYAEPRCDSNVTLFDLEDVKISKTEIYELRGDQLFPSDEQYNICAQNYNKNQCLILFFEKCSHSILEIVKELVTYDNNVICCFHCDKLEEIYPLALSLQQIYKKNCSFFTTLRLIPMNFTVDMHNVINYIYRKINFNIVSATSFSEKVDILELSNIISTNNACLPFVTPATTIISEFTNIKSMLELTEKNKEFINHVKYETLNGDLEDLVYFATVQKNVKVALKKNCYEEECSFEFNESLFSSSAFTINPLPEISLPKPNFSSFSELSTKFNGDLLRENLDSSNLVVITGFSELGPLGNAATRWDFEKNYSKFSTESIIELSLIMGLIKYDAKSCGFIDVASTKVVTIEEIENYEAYILQHTGIRVIEEEILGYDPTKKMMLQEVVLVEEFKVTVPEETMLQYKLEHGEKISVIPIHEENQMDVMFEVTFNPGSRVYLPKALNFDRFVAGQIPLGWNAEFYGISKEIIDQVDRLTLFSLITTAEALITSGIVDPYELYKYMHVSEVGNCSGSGIGGLKSHQKMQKQRFVDDNVQNDILQETFINVMSAWVNMLLLSSSGPIKTPVGACATALESLDLGYETIMSGKASMVLVGGYDDLVEETSYEFGAMGATSNAQKETASGRAPKEMCRPMTSTRNGFMEAHGSGIQVLLRGDLAIKMGLPIFGIVGFTSMNSDKISKSLPAPGQGVLTAARKSLNKKHASRKLSLSYRKNQIKKLDPEDSHTRKYWNIDFYKNDPNISPLEGALSVFGMNIDDISVSTCHGTSTKANDKNETRIVNTIMKTCSRTPGNLLPVVAQKSITGHPKAAAGAWMINGALQMFKDCVVPGNFNADNIDQNLTNENEYLLFNKDNVSSMQTIKSVLVSSFGFGQKGSLALIINPNYILATLDKEELKVYKNKFNLRYTKANADYQYRILNNKLFQEKNTKPFENISDETLYLDGELRLD